MVVHPTSTETHNIKLPPDFLYFRFVLVQQHPRPRQKQLPPVQVHVQVPNDAAKKAVLNSKRSSQTGAWDGIIEPAASSSSSLPLHHRHEPLVKCSFQVSLSLCLSVSLSHPVSGSLSGFHQ